MEISTGHPCAWRQHLLALLIFSGVLVVVFHRAIFFGEVLAPLDLLTKELPWRAVLTQGVSIDNFTTADVLAVFYPWKHFVHDELRAGRFPLWCTHVGCGYPLAGEGVIKLFGLTTLSLWLSPPRVASILTFSGQLLIAITGMYALLCALRMRWSTAVFGALVYGLNSAMVQNLEFEHITGGLMMLPWLCWAVWRAANVETGGWRFTSLSGLFFGLAIINGSLQSAAIVWVSAASFAVTASWRQQRLRFWRLTFGTVAVMTVLGLAVGAIALLPNIELFLLNVRPRFSRIDWWQLTWKRPLALFPALAAMVNPDVLGNYKTFDLIRALGMVGTAATTPVMSDLRVYCGLFAVVLAALGCRARGDAKVLGLVLVVVPVIVAVFTPLYLILYFRVLSSVACGVAVLAALGLERFWEADGKLRRDVRRVALAAAVAVVLTLGAGTVVTAQQATLTEKVGQIGVKATSFYRADRAWQQEKARETVKNFTLRGQAVARFCGLAVLVALVLAARPPPMMLAVAMLVLNTVDLTEFAWRTLPSVPRRFDFPSTPALEFLQRQPGRFRVESSWNIESEPPTARANLLLPAGLDDARVYESLVPANPLLARRDWNALNVQFMVCPPGSLSPASDWRLVYHGEVDIYENPHVEPRVYFTTDRVSPPATPAHVEEYVSGKIRATVDAPAEGWLVVGERLYPGWCAWVNGRRVETVCARELWQAVPVRAGNNTVELRYQPRSVLFGGLMTLAGLATVAGIGCRWKQT